MAPKMLKKVAKSSVSRRTASAEQVSGLIEKLWYFYFYLLVVHMGAHTLTQEASLGQGMLT